MLCQQLRRLIVVPVTDARHGMHHLKYSHKNVDEVAEEVGSAYPLAGDSQGGSESGSVVPAQEG